MSDHDVLHFHIINWMCAIVTLIFLMDKQTTQHKRKNIDHAVPTTTDHHLSPPYTREAGVSPVEHLQIGLDNS